MAKIKSLGGVGMAKIKSLGGVENQNVLNFRGKKLNRLGGVFFNFSRRNLSLLVFNFHIGTTLSAIFQVIEPIIDFRNRETQIVRELSISQIRAVARCFRVKSLFRLT